MSMHQIGFQEVLALAQFQGEYPDEMVLIGVQPEDMTDFGGSLRDSVKARVPEAIAFALEVLDRWGAPGSRVPAAPRNQCCPGRKACAWRPTSGPAGPNRPAASGTPGSSTCIWTGQG